MHSKFKFIAISLLGLATISSCGSGDQKRVKDTTIAYIDTNGPATETVIETIETDSAGEMKVFIREAIVRLDKQDSILLNFKKSISNSKKPEKEKMALIGTLENESGNIRKNLLGWESNVEKEFVSLKSEFEQKYEVYRSKLNNLTLGEDFD